MPYIKTKRREDFDVGLAALFEDLGPEPHPGELNYVITKLVQFYSEVKADTMTYQTIAEVTGVLENVKQEYYRRAAAPHEDTKIAENGDIY